MTLRRLGAWVGFCFLLACATVVTGSYLALLVSGESQMVITTDAFGERGIELVVVLLAWCFVPLTLHELDRHFLQSGAMPSERPED